MKNVGVRCHRNKFEIQRSEYYTNLLLKKSIHLSIDRFIFRPILPKLTSLEILKLLYKDEIL